MRAKKAGSAPGCRCSMTRHCVTRSASRPLCSRRASSLSGSLVLFGSLPKQMFPLSERDQFLIYMNMPDGTAISQTEARALEVSRWLANSKENPEIASHILYVGDGGPRFYLTLTPVPPDPASAFFLVNTGDYHGGSAPPSVRGSIFTRSIPKRASRSSAWRWARSSLELLRSKFRGRTRIVSLHWASG